MLLLLMMMTSRCFEPIQRFRISLLQQYWSGGEGGIRTHGPLRINGFQDRRNRPLCHLSSGLAL
ncbi:hypothetical protein BN874_200053 [Candidatus Contendobacter odensis Run_B_J11]|uniref:Uncharacterized protein n=1 Tax=Candidatus Contendobacter odensis Run_B_J11 TaxID=1400861 RepID=A0A7U7GB27_9GAMM|nr:hypothetical protein BN874_200053 [Candidatus Contendobacter odensis Run_B_J11]